MRVLKKGRGEDFNFEAENLKGKLREMRAFLDDARFKKDANVGGGVADEGEGKRSARTRRWQVVRAVAMGDFGTLSASAFTRDGKTSLSTT